MNLFAQRLTHRTADADGTIRVSRTGALMVCTFTRQRLCFLQEPVRRVRRAGHCTQGTYVSASHGPGQGGGQQLTFGDRLLFHEFQVTMGDTGPRRLGTLDGNQSSFLADEQRRLSPTGYGIPEYEAPCSRTTSFASATASGDWRAGGIADGFVRWKPGADLALGRCVEIVRYVSQGKAPRQESDLWSSTPGSTATS